MIRSFPVRSLAATAFGLATLVGVFAGSTLAEEATSRETAAIQPTPATVGSSSFVVDGPYTVRKPVPTATPRVYRSSLPTCFGKVATITGVVNQYGQTVFTGTAGDDVIIGTEGQDVIQGNGGNDTVCALGDADIVHMGNGNDLIDAGPGKDTVSAGGGNDIVYGRDGDDLIDGGPGDDYLYGGNGNDSLAGGDGNDVLLGEAGDDTLEGGSGVDQLDGGTHNAGPFGGDFCHGGTTIGGVENDTAVNCEVAVAIP